MSLKHSLLGLLNYNDMTGYDLNGLFKRSLFYMWKAQMSQIYRELNSMEKAGWLTSHFVAQTGTPNKKIYAVTPSGQEELRRWLAESDENDYDLPQYGFLMKIFFSGELDVTHCLERLRTFKQSRLDWLDNFQNAVGGFNSLFESVDEDKKRYWDLVGKLTTEGMKMEIKWAEKCIKELERHNHAENN